MKDFAFFAKAILFYLAVSGEHLKDLKKTWIFFVCFDIYFERAHASGRGTEREGGGERKSQASSA